METPDARRVIAERGTGEAPHCHLDVVVEAELSWGNRIDYDWRIVDPHLMDWTLDLAKPFHLDLLRQSFRFAAGVALGVYPSSSGGFSPRMSLATPDFSSIIAPLPRGWSGEYGRIEL